MAAQLIIYTVVHGSVYALLAVGFSLIFGVARLLNMAHTAFCVLAAYVFYNLVSPILGIELGLVPAIIISIVAVTLLGMLVYKFIIDRVREHPGAVLLVTIALAMLIEQALTMRFHGNSASVGFFIGGYTSLFGVAIVNHYFLILGVAVVFIIAVYLFLSKTKMGIAVRAVANDTEIANLMGISPSRILMITMTIATALAAIAGIVIAPAGSFTSPSTWANTLLLVMVIVVIGGLGSIKGSIIGAAVIALVEALCIYDPLGLFGSGAAYLINTLVLLAMVIVLVVRPGGLFGTLFEEEKL
jgi:branched-chain amino acid transport system permease protein